MQERLETIETRLAYQERAIQELSDELYRQRIEIEALQKTCARLADRLAALDEPDPVPSPSDEKPPHY